LNQNVGLTLGTLVTSLESIVLIVGAEAHPRVDGLKEFAIAGFGQSQTEASQPNHWNRELRKIFLIQSVLYYIGKFAPG
jgi:hypothetical protein